jgi:hypothetical protein
MLPMSRSEVFFFPLFFLCSKEHFSIFIVQYLGVTAGIEPDRNQQESNRDSRNRTRQESEVLLLCGLRRRMNGRANVV